VAVALALLFGVFIFIIHRAVLPSFRARQVTGREGMIGLEGKVVQPLVPKGVVRVEGEYWRARSVDGEIAAGETVEVIGLNKLVLEVRHKRQSSKS
jgi:membrane-bound serine protease (ClpP class)